MSAKKRPRPKEKTEEPEGDEAGSWECTVCTYRNRFEAFKCEMCDTRKGTSTRKPRLNQDLQQMHSAVHNLVLQQHQKLPGVPRRRTHISGGGSPTGSRHSPESTSSGSLPKRDLAPAPIAKVKRRKPVPLSDALIFRSSPRKMTVTVRGVSAVITEFRAKPNTSSAGASATSTPPAATVT